MGRTAKLEITTKKLVFLHFVLLLYRFLGLIFSDSQVRFREAAILLPMYTYIRIEPKYFCYVQYKIEEIKFKVLKEEKVSFELPGL